MNAKRRTSRRGQVAIENIVLLVMVIIIVAVGIIVVIQLGIYKPTTQKRGFIGFSQMVVTDWAVSQNGRVYLNIKNEADTVVRIEGNGVNVSFTRVQCNLGPILGGGANNITFQPGEKVVIAIDCPLISSEYEVGDEFDMDVDIAFKDRNNRVFRSVGKIYGFIEIVEPGWMPTTTTTTDTTIPECFYKECNDTLAGQMDPDNCQELIYQGRTHTCEYCTSGTHFPDGISRCYYNGQCGQICSNDNQCEPPDDFLNICTKCVNNKCQENPVPPECGVCPPYDAGKLNSSWCNATFCSYCYPQWIQFSANVGDGMDSFTCEPPEGCGDACSNTMYDDCEQCGNKCPHCEENPSTPGEGMCAQGDCGKRCGPGAPDPTCTIGCGWCNMTSYTCETGDCCKPCGPANPSQVCGLGCDTCFNGYCTKTDIGVSIFAHNGTNGKVVKENQPIQLDVEGSSESYVEKLIVTNGTRLQAPWQSCKDMAAAINDEGEVEPTDPWFAANNVEWWGEFICPANTKHCTHTWMTSEPDIGQYCYFAMAQKHSTDGNGKWSKVAADYIQVGYIQVFLVSPKPL